jgi:hypothetical protein
MNPTRTRLLGVAAALSTLAIAAPAATAVAAPVVPAVAPAVIGPTFITTAPATFVNTNTQVSAGDIASGPQSA